MSVLFYLEMDGQSDVSVQFNDSKGEFQSHRDLHENIGCGHIGLVGFVSLH